MQSKGKPTTKLLLTLVCLLTLLLSACGRGTGIDKSAGNPPTPPGGGTPKVPYGQQIYRYPVVGTDLDIATFDPALTEDTASTEAITAAFAGLVQLDSNLQVQPQLAQSWDQSADGLQWTFHLRPGLTFSDGTPLTSKDVAYSIDRALQPATKSPISLSYLGLIKDADGLNTGKIKTIIGDSILTPDANTVILKTSKKAAYFLYTLTYPSSYVVQKRLVDKYGNDKFTEHLMEGASAGPFVVSRYLHKKEIDFVPNPYYYDFKPLLQKVVFLFVATQDISFQDYQNGELDFTMVPPDRFAEAKQLTMEYTQTPLLATKYIAMNFLVKPFDNLHIRQAFALSLNREIINNTVFGGNRIPTYHIIPQGMVGYNLNLIGPAGVKDSRGNVSLARQLLQLGLQEEGWANSSQLPPIKLTYAKSPVNDKLTTVATQMWQSALGVSVTPNPIDFNVLQTELDQGRGNPNGIQMWSVSWSADYPDPQDWTTINFGKGAVGNKMNYGQNTTADALQEQQVQQQLEQADAESNPATRVLLYQSAEQQLINQVAWIPLYQSTWDVLLKPYVKGSVLNSLQIRLAGDWKNIYIAVH